MTKNAIRQLIARLEEELKNAPEGEPEPPVRHDDNPPHAVCSFCGKPRAEAGPMVEGPNDVYMCEHCVDLAVGIVQAERRKRLAALEAQVRSLESPREGNT